MTASGPPRHADNAVLAALAATFAPDGWLATVSATLGCVLGLASLIALTVTVTLGTGLLVLALAGLLLIWLAFGIARVTVRLDRARFATFLGETVALRPALPAGGSFLSRLWARTKSRRAWLEVLYAGLVMPVLSWVCGTVVVGAWGLGIGFVLFPAYGSATVSKGHIGGWDLAYAPSLVLHLGLGVLALLAAPWLARGAGRLQVAAARAMLSPGDREQLVARVGTLQDTRSRMVAAADAERRRIERDLHDGAQQRLVALAMTLGRAKARLEADPDGARALVDEAHGEAKLALAELRDLARGIHPAVLTDRGLDPALSALAARSSVPVDVEVDVLPRPAPGIEAVAYFVVAETLANIGKHAAASRVDLRVVRRGERLYLSITDDGVGGADLRHGTGLAGLRDRVLAVDGTFSLNSPRGGPTTIRVELPCGS